jgi:hypothetical protein
MPRPRQPSRAEALLLKELDSWKTKVCLLRRELEDKDGIVGRLEILLRERLKRIDNLTSEIERLRAVNKRLDAGSEALARLVCLTAPPTATAEA